MRLIQFGGLALSEYGGEDSFPVAARSAVVGMQNGGFDQDGTAVWFQSRTVTRRMMLVDPIDSQLDTLYGALGMGQRILTAVLRDNTTRRQTWAKVTSIECERGAGTLGQQPVVVHWSMLYPFWMASADEPWYLDNGLLLNATATWYLDAGKIETQAITSSPWAFTVTNAGAAVVRRGTITITPAAAASIVDPWIANLTTGEWVRYVGTISAGQALEIDLLTKTATLNGVDVYANVLVSNRLDWLTLAVGSNSIRVTGTVTGTVTLTWAWARHYL